MKRLSYRERDNAFGQTVLTLRTAIGLTQAELGNHLGVSRRAVSDWEVGNTYPKAEHLKEVIALAVQSQAFHKGRETQEICAFWQTAHQKVPLDEHWLSTLLSHLPSPHLQAGPKPVAKSQPVEAAPGAPTPVMADPASGPQAPLAPGAMPQVDWGEALVTPTFYGREEELTRVTQWIVQEHCRVVSLLGMGGIGKSALTVSLMHHVSEHFDVVIFRSLRDAPSCEVLLDDYLQVLSPQSPRQPTLERRISLLLEHLRKTRVLLVLDNLESLLKEGDISGHFRPGFESYRLLLNRVAETSHQSSLLLTSRERPAELRQLEHKYPQVRSLRLAGLDTTACQQLFMEKEVVGTLSQQEQLIEAYAGNPLALKIVAETIVDLFGSDISAFLTGNVVIFGSITDLLAEHFSRLSHLEQNILFSLAIAREMITFRELLSVQVKPLQRVQVLEAIDSLRRRSLIEPGQRPSSFTLQSVVLEYVTALLIARAISEINLGRLDLLIEHGLSQATAREYVRQTQERLLLSPLLVNLQNVHLGYANETGQQTQDALPPIPLEVQLLDLLDQLRRQTDSAQGYGPANLIALLRLLRGNLNGLDLSHLSIRSAYLQGILMKGCSLAGALMHDCVWTEALGATWSVALSPDGKWWASGDMQGQVRIWEEGGQTLHLSLQAHSDCVLALAFSPDGQTLASGSVEGSIKLWDLQACHHGASPPDALLWKGWQKNPFGLAFSSDGRLLTSGGMDMTIRHRDAHSGLHLQTLGHSPGELAVAFSPDGRLFASGCVNGEIRLWERQKGTAPAFAPILSIQDNSCVSALFFAPDGTMLAGTSMGNQMVKLWEVGDYEAGPPGRLLHTLPEHIDQSWCVAWSPDSSSLAYNSLDKAIRIFDVQEGRWRAALHGHTAEVYAMAFTPDGTKLLSGSADNTLRVWDVLSSRCVHVIQGYQRSHWDLDWNPDGQHLVSAGTDGLVTLWDMSERTPPRILHGHKWFVTSVGWSPDGRHLVSAGTDGLLLLWDPITHTCRERFGDPEVVIFKIAWSPREYLLACGTYQRGIQVWDMTTHHLRWSSNSTLCESYHALAWSPNGQLLAAGGEDGCVYLWESTDGTLRAKLSSHQGWVWSIAWSPDGRYLASGGEELFIWDVETAERVQTLTRHSDMVSALAWCPHGHGLVSGENNGLLYWWDVKSGQCVNRHEAHSKTIRTLKVSPDGKFLASCGEDGAIRICDLKSRSPVRTLRRDRPYERLNITGIRGLTEAEIASLQALGAIEEAP